MRDNFELPFVLKYDRRFYNETSPWLFMTNGSHSKRSDTEFQVQDISFLSRGIVMCYPLLRGTHYLDRDWFTAGIGERKLTHMSDLIDSAIFVK